MGQWMDTGVMLSGRRARWDMPMKTRLLLCAWMVFALSGCAGGGKAAPADDYASLFSRGEYARAYDAAAKDAGSMRGKNRDMAALIAGQSAYRLGRTAEASKWLTPLTDHADPAIAGRANATLGSINEDRGAHAAAADYFVKAADRLTGDDAARAYMYAGDARQGAKQNDRARALYEKARLKVSGDATLRTQIADRLAGGGPVAAAMGKGFTIQAGAYATRAGAEAAARRLAAHGPRVVPTRDRAGKTLYAVRVGRYAGKADAAAAARAVGAGAFVTTGE